MTYRTEMAGELRFAPPLTQEQHADLLARGNFCIPFDGNEPTAWYFRPRVANNRYMGHLVEALDFMVKLLGERGVYTTGEIYGVGEDYDDVWVFSVRDGVTKVKRATLTWPDGTKVNLNAHLSGQL